MGNTNRSWAENEARLRDEYGTARRPGESAKELLKYSDTNRRVNEDMAKWCMAGRVAYAALIAGSSKPKDAVQTWGWMIAIIEDAEKYQLTLDDKQDARNEFLEAVSYLAKAQNNKNGGQMRINTNGGGSDDSQA